MGYCNIKNSNPLCTPHGVGLYLAKDHVLNLLLQISVWFAYLHFFIDAAWFTNLQFYLEFEQILCYYAGFTGAVQMKKKMYNDSTSVMNISKKQRSIIYHSILKQ